MNYEKLMSKKNSEGKDAVDFLNEASELMDKDKFKNASDLLTQGIHLCGHPRLYFNRGYCYHQLKNAKDAIKDFNKSLANDRGNDLLDHEKQRLYLYMGIIHEEMENDEDKAIEAYKKAADWGYAGAIGRLEKLGIDYTPQSTNESAEPAAVLESKRNSSSAKKAAAAKTPASSSTQNAASSNQPKKKSKLRFLLPCLIGAALGIGVFLLLQNAQELIAEKTTAKKQIITTRVISDAVSLRADPYVYSDILKVLYSGYVVEITGDVSGDFTPVEYESIRGWVISVFLER